MVGGCFRLPLVLATLASTLVTADNFPRQTGFGNSTAAGAGTGTAPASGVPTPPPCCWIVAGTSAVGLNLWYTSTAEHVVATVITTYIRENNGSAVPLNSTTLYVTPNATAFPTIGLYGPGPIHPWVTVPGVPATLLPKGFEVVDYARSMLDNTTAMTFPHTDLVVQQPTPYDEWMSIGIYTTTPSMSNYPSSGLTAWPSSMCGSYEPWIKYGEVTQLVTNDGTVTTSYTVAPTVTTSKFVPSNVQLYTALSMGIADSLNVTYILPKTTQMHQPRVLVGFPTGLVDWLGTQENVIAKYRYIKDCWWDDRGEGQPTVHVPVNALTVTSSHIIYVQKPTTAPTIPTTDGSVRTSTLTARTEVKDTSLDAPIPTTTTTAAPAEIETTDKRTSQGKVRTESKDSSLDVPATTHVTAGEPGTALPIRTSDAGKGDPTPGGTVDSTDGSKPKQPQGGIEQQTKEQSNPVEHTESQVTHAQNTAQPAASGIGGLISAIQSVASKQGGTPADSNGDKQDTPARPAGVVTTASRGSGPAPSVTGFAVGSQTASPGGAAITQGGSTFSALPSGSGLQVVAGGKTSTIAGAVSPGVAVVQEPGSEAGYIVGDQTVTAGGPVIAIGGSTYSALPGGSGVQVVADGRTSTALVTAPSGISIAQATDADNAYVVGGNTFAAGGPAISSGGSTLSALPSGSGVLIVANGETRTVPVAALTGSSTLRSGDADNEYVFAGNTLTAGGDALTSASTTYSALLSGSGIAIAADGTTSTIKVGQSIDINTAGIDSTSPTPVLLPASPQQLVTIGGSTYTAHATEGSLLVVDGHTLRPGATTVINGETVVLTGTNLVLATGTSTSTRGLGDAIMSGIGGGSGGDETSTTAGPESQETASGGQRSISGVSLSVGWLVSGMFAFALL